VKRNCENCERFYECDNMGFYEECLPDMKYYEANEEYKMHLLIKKLHKLTSNYMKLDNTLSNAYEISKLKDDIETTSREICILGTDLSDGELLEFLNS
jgi:hypothetical protein